MRFIKEKKIVDENAEIDFFSNIFSSFFYTGYFPKASGTFASLAAMVIFLLKIFQNPTMLSLLIILTFAAGIYTSKTMMRRFGDDPSVVVIDEAVGMWITVLIFIIFSQENFTLFYAFVCFLAFRFFDITKIQPAKYFDRLHTGFGVMMDDVIAGVYAGVASYLFSLIVSR
ncbi:MAG TPA: phosphatidylglycerophosphatase A [Ignavibacteria bacterium]|nr:phosphatidylglycerophosphatase A [Ignavibacteria bacterium]